MVCSSYDNFTHSLYKPKTPSLFIPIFYLINSIFPETLLPFSFKIKSRRKALKNFLSLIIVISISSFSFAIGLDFSTYIGGSDNDEISSLKMRNNDIVFCGYTYSQDYPTVSGSYQSSFGGNSFTTVLSALNPIGTNLLFSTFIGSGGGNSAQDIKIFPDGRILLVGEASSNHPTTQNAFDTSFKNGDGYFTILDSNATTILYSSLFGNDGFQEINSAEIDFQQNIVFAGETSSTGNNFPLTTGVIDSDHQGSMEIFISKFDSSASTLIYSTFLGGSSTERYPSLNLDSLGNALVCGLTSSNDFITTPNSFKSYNYGNTDVFLSKINPNGDSLIFSTYLGGNNASEQISYTVKNNGEPIIAGRVNSADFPLTSGIIDSSLSGNSDIFITKFNSLGTALDFSTFIGGNSSEETHILSSDSNGLIFVSGWTSSSDFPITTTTYDNSKNSYSDAFLIGISQNGDLLKFSTFFGGSNGDIGRDLIITGNNSIILTGYTNTIDFPITSTAFNQTYNGGNSDAFISKFNFANSVISNNYLDFSDVISTSDSTIQITLFSTGKFDFVIDSVVVQGSYFSTDLLPATIPIGDSISFNVNFSPILTGQFSGEVLIYSNDFDDAYNSIDLIANSIFDSTDSILPDQIINFKPIQLNSNEMVLIWDTTGDDSTFGQCVDYEIGYSITELDEINFPNSNLINHSITPSPSGSIDTIQISGLNLNSQYYFGIKAIDNGGNKSPLSLASNFDKPQITSINDVANDNGGQVIINFRGSLNDYIQNTGFTVSTYAVYRKISNQPATNKNPNQIDESLPSGNWGIIATVPAFADTSYSVFVTTTGDSNSTGLNSSEYLVRAQAFGNPAVNSVSNIFSGYSIDNIAPPIPQNQNFVDNGNGTITATWNTVTANDLAFYTLYSKSPNGDFMLVSQFAPTSSITQNETFSIVSNSVGYRIGSIDINGNESLPFANRITSLEIENIGSDIVLSWKGKLSATNYKIYRSLSPNSTNPILIGNLTPNGLDPTYTDLGVLNTNVKYFYYVIWED